VPLFKPDAAQTLAWAALLIFLGLFLKNRVHILNRLNIPSPVVGGTIVAVTILLLRQGVAEFQFDRTVEPILQVAFFTSIGMSASLALLRRGGIPTVIFLVMSTVMCLVQNFLGMGIAQAFGIHPLVGVMAGSVTLVGGPATGAAFAGDFEKAGVIGAASLAIAAATFGIVCGGLLGAPLGTWLVERRAGRVAHKRRSEPHDDPAFVAETETRLEIDAESENTPLLRNILILCVAMGVGAVVSAWIRGQGVTLPAYIGAMMVASILRNLDDATGWLKISAPFMDLLGSLSLTLYLALILLNLRLWELAHLALPLVTILIAQVIVTGLFALVVSYPVMGRDYESAVMAGGFVGFVLGTTANALTNMRTLVERYGPAPRAFLIVPLVGAFFIDFINALIITTFLNWFGK
jgi:ESS family glutamate:Na+ symporter